MRSRAARSLVVAFAFAAIVASAAFLYRSEQQVASSTTALRSLDLHAREAAAALAEFGDIDTRARDYMKSGEQLMAADVIFTEGTSTTGNAAREVEAARLAEHQDFDQSTSDHRRQEAIGAAAAAGVGLLGL